MIMDNEKEHKWDGYGETCIDCGDKDWFAEANCFNSKNVENSKYKIIDEPDAWASINQCIGENYKNVRYEKLPIQSLNPLMYKHEKLYSENKVIGLMKAYYYDGYTEGLTFQEHEIQTLRAKVSSAKVLVEALETIATESHPELWQVEVAIKALATYEKLSETNTEVGQCLTK